MTKAFMTAIWEWVPGVVAGGLPMLVFLMHAPFAAATAVGVVGHGLAAHMLILAIANSSVSVVTSFSRTLRGKIPNLLRDGRGPVVLMIVSVVTLVYVTVLYTLEESGQDGQLMNRMALAGLMASLLGSLYMEFAIARLHELARVRRRAGPRIPSTAR